MQVYSDTEERLRMDYYEDSKIIFFKQIIYLLTKFENDKTGFNILEISYSHFAVELAWNNLRIYKCA